MLWITTIWDLQGLHDYRTAIDHGYNQFHKKDLYNVNFYSTNCRPRDLSQLLFSSHYDTYESHQNANEVNVMISLQSHQVTLTIPFERHYTESFVWTPTLQQIELENFRRPILFNDIVPMTSCPCILLSQWRGDFVMTSAWWLGILVNL